MRRIKGWELFEDSQDDEWRKLPKERRILMRKFLVNGIQDCTISDGVITFPLGMDVDGKGLTTLIGMPDFVGGFFSCMNNKLTSLEGAPNCIKSGLPYSFDCDHNRITSLVGLPKGISYHKLDISHNAILTLEGCPDRVVNFVCESNKITNLKGGPTDVIKYTVNDCMLTSLEGAPERLEGHFSCTGNKLTDLKGGPKSTGNYFCSGNPLKSFDGIPEEIIGTFYCDSISIYGDELGTIEGFINAINRLNFYSRDIPMLAKLMAHFKDKINPIDLHLLDGYPDLKKAYLEESGTRDLSVIGRNLKLL